MPALVKRYIITSMKWMALLLFTLMLVWYYACPSLLIKMVGQDYPALWSEHLYTLNFAEIQGRLGKPDADFAAKDFQQWYKATWWGTYVLTISASNCCDATSKPDQIAIRYYLHRRYAAIGVRDLRKLK